ncbi:MAG: T9SS type A sorting domain-containing protein [Bacteroidota bacterium]|nr:T9SS type A sorting domain-containing protein [Bacteroidota bacterium]
MSNTIPEIFRHFKGRKIILAGALMFLSCSSVFSQEILTGLQFSPVIHQKWVESRMQKSISSENDTLPIRLPFYDDFSKPTVFPSTDRWIDREAFVNTDYPVYPVNLGAVTLDAINDSGSMYSDAVPGPQTFIADHLTSRYIRMDSIFSPAPKALTPADSVYLSFYYQPQGRGLFPSTSDSLVLRFLIQPAYDSISPTDTVHFDDQWLEIWSTKGMSLDTFYFNNNVWFKRVMIPIKDHRFFKRNFRFQFYNYVSLASSSIPAWQSNCDQWNIDEIYLNAHRNIGDTVTREIRFLDRPPSMLKSYESMPYTQYCNNPTAEMQDSLHIYITNRDTISHNTNYSYSMYNESGSFNKTYNGGNHIIEPFYDAGYVTYPPFAHPPIQYFFPISNTDSAIFFQRHIIKDVTPGSVLGDTISREQKFYNYYAYDDGTPEAGYGLKGTGALMAYRFQLDKSPDTLRAISIYFNKTLADLSQNYFYLTVWNDNSGTPGDTIYSQLVLPHYTDTLNKFYTYHLSPALRISGTFYIGTIQTTDNNMNIGFDRYNNSQDNLFYNTTGNWISSSYSGALMMRPIIGKPIPLGIQEIQIEKRRLAIYPNPARGNKVNIVLPAGESNDYGDWNMDILTMTGSRVYSGPYVQQLDISTFSGGIYIIDCRQRNSGIHYFSKLVVIP